MDEEEKQKEQVELEKINKALKKRDYTYETILGRGSYGLVVKAKHHIDENNYAIKVISAVDETTEKYRKREVEILASKCDLWERNIVKYFACWESIIDEHPYLFIQMELCLVDLASFVYNNEMGNANIVRAQGQPRFYQHVFLQLLKGLNAIHSIGWVHRDLTVRNILIANPKPSKIHDIVIKIADFGLAREIDSVIDASTSLTDGPKLEKLSTDIGNELFRAPELSTENYDYKVDLYSAGIVLYFLSRYLEDRKQWKAELSQLRNDGLDQRRLSHQDDPKLPRLIERLLDEKAKYRPTAAEALTDMKSKKPTESTDAGATEAESKDAESIDAGLTYAKQHAGKRFYVKKDGEGECSRCSSTGDTVSSLKQAIECCTGVKADSQVLRQKTIIEGVEEMIKIVTDIDVRMMFQSADEAKKKVVLIVSDEKSGTETSSDIEETEDTGCIPEA